MTVIQEKEKVTLKLGFDNGTVDGKQKIRSKNINKIKLDSKNEDLYEVSKALGSLSKKELLEVKKVEETLLVE